MTIYFWERTKPKSSEDHEDSYADRCARMQARKEELISEVNPLCKECRRLEVREDFRTDSVLVFCEQFGNVNAEGTECYGFISERDGCETCALAECLGTMLGGRKVLTCPLGMRACEGNICRLYRRRVDDRTRADRVQGQENHIDK